MFTKELFIVGSRRQNDVLPRETIRRAVTVGRRENVLLSVGDHPIERNARVNASALHANDIASRESSQVSQDRILVNDAFCLSIR